MAFDPKFLDIQASSIRRVAVIGAGPAGVSAAKALLADDHFKVVDVYEQRGCFGGAWNFTPRKLTREPSITELIFGEDGLASRAGHAQEEPPFATPMYDDLHTNIPHYAMCYSDDPSLEDNELFPAREAVLAYLNGYGVTIKPHVRFNTQVIHVKHGSERRFQLQSLDLKSKETSERPYDAVCIANGHYSDVRVPMIRGLREWDKAYPKSMAHSKFYRNAEEYRDQKVIVVGHSASGSDISSQITRTARQPVLVSVNKTETSTYEPSCGKIFVSRISQMLPPSQANRAVQFEDGTIEKDIDRILFCTGYYHSLPFLSSLSPSIPNSHEHSARGADDELQHSPGLHYRQHPRRGDSDWINHTYQHIFYVSDPRLAFIGLPAKILPFPTFEAQAKALAAVWSGRRSLPSDIESYNDLTSSEDTIQLKSAGQTSKPQRRGSELHNLNFPDDLHYYNTLQSWTEHSDKIPTYSKNEDSLLPETRPRQFWFRESIPALKQAFAEKGDNRHSICTMQQLGYHSPGFQPPITS